MIRYALVCERKHNFEIWFSDSGDYDKQRKRGLVTCPVCDSKKIEKAIMAPSIARGAKEALRARSRRRGLYLRPRPQPRRLPRTSR